MTRKKLRKKLNPSFIIAISIWLFAQLVYASVSAALIFQDKSDIFSAKADEIAACLDRRIDQNFAFVKSFEIFSVLSGTESMKVFSSLVQHTMQEYPRIHLVNLYTHTHHNDPLSPKLTASFPVDEDDTEIRSIMPKVLNQPHGTIRGFADPRFPGQYFTTAHAQNGNFHYAIVMLVNIKEMLKPLLTNTSSKIEWIIGGIPTILLNEERDSIFNNFLTVEKTIVAGTSTISPQDFTWFPEGTVFRISETISLAELFSLAGLIVYGSLSAIAVTAGYYALHQRQLSQRLLLSEMEARKRAKRLESENRLEHAARVNAVGELAAGIIHELAQPLTSLLNQSQASIKVLEENTVQVDFLKRAMDANVRDAKRAGRILGKIRDYIVNTAAPPEITTLNSAIMEIVEILNLEIKRQGVSLTLCLAEPSPTANINKVELEQVIHNLVRNSIEALNLSEQVEKRITIETIADRTENIIRVSDNGPGIDQEALAHLFQPFFTTKASGMGLGLSLSQRIVQRIGGLLSASNKDGAVFTISLPKAETVPAMITGRIELSQSRFQPIAALT